MSGRLIRLCLPLFLCVGCMNPKQEIDKRLSEARASANQATQSIQTARQSLTTARTEYESGRTPIPAILEADELLGNANDCVASISDGIERAQSQVPNVENKENPWDWFLAQLPWMIPTLLVLAAAIYFGVGKIVRPLLGGVGNSIAEALGKTDAKVETQSMTPREAIAARRASLGKAYENAYKQQKEKLQ